MKRVHSARGALPLFDYSDPSAAGLSSLLLRAAFAPPFLRSAEGRRFLSSVFSLDEKLTQQLAGVVRSQLPHAKAPLLDAYADVLARAWRGAVGAPLLSLERSILQAREYWGLGSPPPLCP